MTGQRDRVDPSGAAKAAAPGTDRAPGQRSISQRCVPEHRLRDMTAADIDTVCGLEQSLFPADNWPRQMFVDELAQPQTRRYLVAELAGRIVGYAGMMCILPLADVQTIAVLPECEGRGIGRALLSELLAEAGRRGAADVLLEVRADNPRAQQLYLRFGFEQIHTRPRYYRDGTDALIMRLRLTATDEVQA